MKKFFALLALVAVFGGGAALAGNDLPIIVAGNDLPIIVA